MKNISESKPMRAILHEEVREYVNSKTISAKSITEDANKLSLLTECVDKYYANINLLPVKTKLYVNEALKAIKSKENTVKNMQKLSVVSEMIHNKGLSANINLLEDSNIEEVQKELKEMNESFSFIVAAKLPSVPFIITEKEQENLYKTTLKTILEEVNKEEQINEIANVTPEQLQTLTRTLGALRKIVQAYPELTAVKKVLTFFSQRLQGFLKSSNMQSLDAKQTIAQAFVFIKSLSEFFSKDLPIIVETDPMQQLLELAEKEGTDKSLQELINLPEADFTTQDEIMKMFINALGPTTATFGFIRGILAAFGKKQPKLGDVLRAAKTSPNELAEDFLQLTLEDLAELSKSKNVIAAANTKLNKSMQQKSQKTDEKPEQANKQNTKTQVSSSKNDVETAKNLLNQIGTTLKNYGIQVSDKLLPEIVEMIFKNTPTETIVATLAAKYGKRQNAKTAKTAPGLGPTPAQTPTT